MKKSSSITALFLYGSITGNHLQLSYNPKPKYRIKSQKLQIHKAFNINDLKNIQKTQTFYISDECYSTLSVCTPCYKKIHPTLRFGKADLKAACFIEIGRIPYGSAL